MIKKSTQRIDRELGLANYGVNLDITADADPLELGNIPPCRRFYFCDNHLSERDSDG